VVLPNEAHGYRARESVLHTLAEMIEWADRWAKNRPPAAAP
jgi:dipeptidyl aminopeptidase/acylaminoacyl peptidase